MHKYCDSLYPTQIAPSKLKSPALSPMISGPSTAFPPGTMMSMFPVPFASRLPTPEIGFPVPRIFILISPEELVSNPLGIPKVKSLPLLICMSIDALPLKLKSPLLDPIPEALSPFIPSKFIVILQSLTTKPSPPSIPETHGLSLVKAVCVTVSDGESPSPVIFSFPLVPLIP